MNLKKCISLVLLLCGLAVSSMAQDDHQDGQQQQRTFRYYSFDAVNANYSNAGTTTLTLKTTVDVSSFLYFSGNLDADWTVNGWGSGSSTETNTLKFYHNGTLTFVFSNFADPAKISGSKTGAQSISLNGQLQFYNDAKKNLIYDTSLVPIGNLNTIFGGNGPQFTTAATGGVLRINFSRQINVAPNVGPGKYQNIGMITVTRN